MSDPKLVSPLLDGFTIGESLSCHDGVRCYPAIREDSDEKYIIKIISVPASQRQLDALLLTGAYKDAASAAVYFKELADGIVAEVKLLQQLSRLEGFLPYSGWQVVPMEGDDLGYEIYLVSTYKRSLEKYLRRDPMTHLGAVNLGLDLCAALAICRRSGNMFVDLKPGNIYLTGEREYRIGDLGFVKLSSLKYTSLPSRYISDYTPPELRDDLATLNPTVDIYAVGTILYQLYNDGVLPTAQQLASKSIPAPANADSEMAEIILKACSPNPRNRYQTPIEMGQALVSYMQRNTVNDIPIAPAPTEEPEAEAADEAAVPEVPVEADGYEPPEPAADDASVQEAEEPEDILNDGLLMEDTGDSDSDAALDEAAECAPIEAVDLRIPPEDEQFDELSAPVAVLSPESDDLFPSEPERKQIEEDEDWEAIMRGTPEENEEDWDDDDVFWEPPKAKKKKGGVLFVVLLLLLALLAGGGFYYYQNYYLLPIENMDISGYQDSIVVSVTTQVDTSILQVVCTDSYGNTLRSDIQDGKAEFTGLDPDTQYKVTIEPVSGFHQMSKSYFASYSTGKQTTIVDFTAKTGLEDGSVILNFTVNGPESQDWVVEYVTEGEETQSMSFTGHMVTISGLSVGKMYDFTLLPPPGTDQWIAGTNTLKFAAARMVLAEQVSILSCEDGILTAQWAAPADITVNNWTVRCYSPSGYDKTITTADTTAQFDGLEGQSAYTVEVWAEGMTQSVRAYVTANPTVITNVFVTPETSPETGIMDLHVSWTFEGTTPEEGWLLMYTVDGREYSEVVTTKEPACTIKNAIPSATYALSVENADGSTVFKGTTEYTPPAAADFDDYSLKAESISASMCPTPEQEGWTYKDVADEDYVSAFSAGSEASLVLYSAEAMNYPTNSCSVMFVIRNEAGQAISELTRVESKPWNTLWKNRYCTLDVPAMPADPGSYTVEIYFNGAFAVSKDFTITE